MEKDQGSPGRQIMRENSIIQRLFIILSNYRNILIALLYFIAFVLFITAVSTAITFPLWFAATNYSKTYSAVVILIVLLTIMVLSVRRMKKWIAKKKGSGISNTSIILIPVRKTAVFLVFFSVLYLIVLMFSQHIPLPAISLSIVYLLALGYYFFIIKKNANSRN